MKMHNFIREACLKLGQQNNNKAFKVKISVITAEKGLEVSGITKKD